MSTYLQVDIDDSSMVTDWPRSWRKCHAPIISLVSAYGLFLTRLLVHCYFLLTLDIADMFYVHRQISLVDASCTTQILLVSCCTSYWNHIMWISCSVFFSFASLIWWNSRYLWLCYWSRFLLIYFYFLNGRNVIYLFIFFEEWSICLWLNCKENVLAFCLPSNLAGANDE